MRGIRVLISLALAALLMGLSCPLGEKTLVVYTHELCVDQYGDPFGVLVPAVPEELAEQYNRNDVFRCKDGFCTPGTFFELNPPFGLNDAVAFSRRPHADQAHACCAPLGPDDAWVCTLQELGSGSMEVNRIFDEFGGQFTPEQVEEILGR